MMKKYAQKCKQLRTQKSDNKDRHSAICLDHSFWFYLQNQFKIYATQSVVAQLRKTNLQKRYSRQVQLFCEILTHSGNKR